MFAELTIEDYESLPDALARNRELVDGQLVDVSGNTAGHNLVRDFLAANLFSYVEERGLGKVMWGLGYAFGENAHGPDVSFLLPEKAARLGMHRRVQMFVPDLAAEVSAPNDRLEATLQKGCALP